MNKIGIIAEYNPFHNGHLYQINKIKEMYPDSIIIVILNGNFTQKGEVSIINKWDKARILLNHNVDLVVELPIYYGINSSDIFASGSLKILNELQIDTLVFGTERDDISDIKKSVEIIDTDEFKSKLKDYLDKGNSFPKSYYDALKDLSNVEIKTPNDILAFSYINEIYKNNYKIDVVNIKRTNDYNSLDLNGIASATAIRHAIKNNLDISSYIPSDVKEYINNIDINDYFLLLKYKILSDDDLSDYHGIKEGIDSRIKKYIKEVNSIDELIDKIKTKRYTRNRIKRILLYILLDIKKYKPVDYIRPLAFNEKGEKYLKSIKSELTLPLISNYSKNKDYLFLEYKSNSIYSLMMKDINKSIRDELSKPIKN